ncbi:FAD binding domain-containing protein [Mucilaginibacter sp. HMF5004]|uniref:FAD binding domain-containing protein n=1 Tax=Mucilaginibacter rivuli TaxID=2857527 RepID=UPI001C6012A7|nr:FAD binding domain-containing protein [Mucilaginibacter rivuli]MBW4891831.1 FAD binding domain-containing protein [Mucilaginibacter rivuli]
MTKFILNNKEITTVLPQGMLLLDFIRYQQNLKGTKIGCREGDCGACTVLLGELKDGQVKYQSATSCLTPLGNIHNKHVVTVEGVNMEALNPIQQAMCDTGGTQCGFCTPGFIVSMAGYCLSDAEPTQQNAVAAVDGNICRCTGYKSIERALDKLNVLLADKPGQDATTFVTEKAILPSYFISIPERLKLLQASANGTQPKPAARFVGGGTDLYVQQHEAMVYADIDFLAPKQELKGVSLNSDTCTIGGATTVTQFASSPIIQKAFANVQQYVELVSSTPIRNIATFAGNFVNASPIGDFSIFFLALDAQLEMRDGTSTRNIPLRQFYKGYKTLDKQPQEYISKFSFRLPDANTLFNFEKVSKRTHLDIASVNSAIELVMNGDTITVASISAGGVGPTPLYLTKASAFFTGKTLTEDLVLEAIEIAQTEVSPISDARGTDDYKRLLLGQLIKAHFIKLFPALQIDKLLTLAV